MRVVELETQPVSGSAEYRTKSGGTCGATTTATASLASQQGREKLLLANEEDLVSFCGRSSDLTSSSDKENPQGGVVFGILAEIASRGVLRYKWEHVKVLFISMLKTRLSERKGKSSKIVEVGPQPAQDNQQKDLIRLSGLVNSFRDYPFTAQRISELLLLGGEYYASWEKFVWALEKCLSVTETVQQQQPDRCPQLPRVVELEKEVDQLRREITKQRPSGPDHRQQHQKKNFVVVTTSSAQHHPSSSPSSPRGGVQVQVQAMSMMSSGPEIGPQPLQPQPQPQPSTSQGQGQGQGRGADGGGGGGVGDIFEEDSGRGFLGGTGRDWNQDWEERRRRAGQMRNESAREMNGKEDWEGVGASSLADGGVDPIISHLADFHKNKNGEMAAAVTTSPPPQVMEMHGTVPFGTSGGIHQPLVHESLDLVSSHPQPGHNSSYLDTTNQSMMLESPQKKHKMNSEEINSEA